MGTSRPGELDVDIPGMDADSAFAVTFKHDDKVRLRVCAIRARGAFLFVDPIFDSQPRSPRLNCVRPRH